MAGAHDNKKTGKSNGQMVVAIVATIAAAAIIFGGGTYLFTKFFTASFHTFDESNTVKLVESEYRSTVEVPGSIKATDSTSVSPEVDGTVKTVDVKDGDKVSAGDVLFTMENSSLTDAVDRAKEAYEKDLKKQAKAQATYDKAAKSAEAAEDKLEAAREQAQERAQAQAASEAQARAAANDGDDDEDADADEAAGDEDADAEQSVDYEFDSTVYDEAIQTARETLKTAKEALDEAKAAAGESKRAYDTAAAQIEKLRVVAPSSGTVVDLQVEKGTTSSAINTAGYALRIIDLETLVGIVEVPESGVGSVSVGQDCTVSVGSGQDATQVNATVYKVADAPKKGSKDDTGEAQYQVQLTLDSLSGNVKYGMSITAQIELRDFGTVYYVPSGAVAENGTGAYVEVVYNDKTTEQHGVTVIDVTDDGQAIIQGNALSKDMTIRSDIS